jgi:hypothetical protein
MIFEMPMNKKIWRLGFFFPFFLGKVNGYNIFIKVAMSHSFYVSGFHMFLEG